MFEPWPLCLQELLRTGPCVMITLAGVKGSAPRHPGTRMLVNSHGFKGSIGGGNLEAMALENAHRLLDSGRTGHQESTSYGLGPALNQCCGGAVDLLFEYCDTPDVPWLREAAAATARPSQRMMISALDTTRSRKWVYAARPPGDLPGDVTRALRTDPPPPHRAVVLTTGSGRYLVERLPESWLRLYLFGAGHVGKAVVHALEALPFEIHWVDSRPGEIPGGLRASVRPKPGTDPLQEVAASAPGSLYLVMTHSHALDEDICNAVLRRSDFRWLGLIGSRTKYLRFRHRLEARGIEPSVLDRLSCPVGLAGVRGKQPATIAVAIAAQLLAEQVPDGWK